MELLFFHDLLLYQNSDFVSGRFGLPWICLFQIMDSPVVFYSLVSTFLVSLVSFAGIATLSFKRRWLDKCLFLLISLSAGALLGDVFIHLLPEIIEEHGGFSPIVSLLVLCGIIGFFILEKFLIWHHHHSIETPEDHRQHQHSHTQSLGVMNLIGDAFHNLLDGMIIAASFLISPVVGVSTTLAVILHEIPQEIGDFGVLIHSGFSVKKGLFFNFLTGSVAILGALLVIIIGNQSESILHYLIPFTAGGFIYIAGSDLIPELKKERVVLNSLFQLIALLMGVGIMYALIWFE